MFLNHFIVGMDPLDAVQKPRVYHKVRSLLRPTTSEFVTDADMRHRVLLSNVVSNVLFVPMFLQLIPNVVTYENQTVGDGEVIALSGAARAFLERRGHRLRSTDSGAVCQFIVHELAEPAAPGHGGVFRGRLTAVSDPRKGGSPAGL